MVCGYYLSSVLQDNDHALVSVTCFKKVADEFKQKARENRFVVRDFAYDEEQLKSGEAKVPMFYGLIYIFDDCRQEWVDQASHRQEKAVRAAGPVA